MEIKKERREREGEREEARKGEREETQSKGAITLDFIKELGEWGTNPCSSYVGDWNVLQTACSSKSQCPKCDPRVKSECRIYHLDGGTLNVSRDTADTTSKRTGLRLSWTTKKCGHPAWASSSSCSISFNHTASCFLLHLMC